MSNTPNTPSTEVQEPKKNIIESLKKTFVGFKSEFKKIVWPTFKQVRQNTIVTIAMIFLVGIFIWIVDAVLMLGLNQILEKL